MPPPPQSPPAGPGPSRRGLAIEAPGPGDIEPPVPEAAVRWDDTVDVAVLGWGCAGAAAAIGAAGAGASVLVVERTGGAGGSAAISGGWIYLGGGTPVQRACGVEDPPEEMARFLAAALGPGADGRKVEEYAAGSVDHFGWLSGLGVPFGDTLVDTRSRGPAPGDGLAWMGEDTALFAGAARPAPRGHRPGGAGMQGAVLMEHLGRAAGSAARASVDSRALQLVVAGDGAVAGVAVRRFSETYRVRARAGVVVATGGFTADAAMVARHVPGLAGHSHIGTDTDDGWGIRLAAGAGAGLRGMGTGQVSLGIAPALLAVSAVVDARGRRFVNEDTYPGRVGQAALFDHGARAFAVFDEATYDSVPETERMGQAPARVAATPEELAAELGLPAAALAETLRRYTAGAEAGTDPEFGKAARWLRPLRPPYGAIDLRSPGRLGAAAATTRTGFGVFTLGGIATDEWGRALTPGGSPVPGLFAAGRAASGMHGRGYITGTSIGDATFFGRRAGREAARGRGA